MSRASMYFTAFKSLGLCGMFARRRTRRLSVGTAGIIQTKWSKFPLWVRGGTSDQFVFDQIFLDREYRCLDNMKCVKTIVDAGANVGYSSAYLLSKFPLATTICIEPDSENFEQLALNLEPFKNRVDLVRAALWSKNTTLSFDSTTTDAGHEWGRKVIRSGNGGVTAMDIPTVMQKFGMSEIDILKIDIEGAEKEIFSAHDISWLDKVRSIVIELHSEECESIFYAAIGDRYRVSRCDELTVCLPK